MHRLNSKSASTRGYLLATVIDKSNDRVRQMFGEIAPRYDRLNHLLSLNIDHYWRWRTVRQVPPTSDAPILDLCTGTGDLAIAYHKRAGRDGFACPIVAADFCRGMLELGGPKSRILPEGGRIRFIEADAQRLPLPDDTFQIVSVAFGLRNVEHTDRGLREMVRVCAPGGKVAVLEFSTPQRQPLRALYGWYFRHVLPRIGQLLARNRFDAYSYLPETVGEFPQGDALADRMRTAGLRDVSYRHLTFGVATLYVGTK